MKFSIGKPIIPKPQTGVAEKGDKRISFSWKIISSATCEITPIAKRKANRLFLNLQRIKTQDNNEINTVENTEWE